MSIKADINGEIRFLTDEEVAELEKIQSEDFIAYWSIPYDEAVNREIRNTYTESAELAILRQRNTKSDEFARYFNFCENKKAYVKQMQAKAKELELSLSQNGGNIK